MDSLIPHPTILGGRLVDLLPLEETHFDSLFEAASDKRIWEFSINDCSDRKTFNRVYEGTLARRDQGQEYPFVIRLKATGRIIGTTRLMDIVPYDRRLEIGGTWLVPQYWATAINPDCKLTLLSYSFETLRVKRVQLKTQHNNMRSRKAIEKIGGVFEGILRQHILKDDGTFRDSAYFSLLDDEWPAVKPRLTDFLERKIRENRQQLTAG